MDPERQKRLNEVAGIAVRIERDTGVPAVALVSQWAIESKWGARPVGNANYFGIKRADRHNQCCTVTTHEVVDGKRIKAALEFADYASLEDSCRDYAWLISRGSPYAHAWLEYLASHDSLALIAAIARTYATDPAYATLARTVAMQADVRKAISDART